MSMGLEWDMQPADIGVCDGWVSHGHMLYTVSSNLQCESWLTPSGQKVTSNKPQAVQPQRDIMLAEEDQIGTVGLANDILKLKEIIAMVHFHFRNCSLIRRTAFPPRDRGQKKGGHR